MNMMSSKLSIAALSASVFLFVSSPQGMADDGNDVWLSGVIKTFECGDNCYLTITQSDGQEETGLCVATTCKLWWENQRMPSNFVGKPVKVKLGVRWKVDGNYDRVGYGFSFEEVQLVQK